MYVALPTSVAEQDLSLAMPPLLSIGLRKKGWTAGKIPGVRIPEMMF